MKRRIIAALAAAALACTVGAGVSPAAADEMDGAAYVAIGDSVAAGNGLMPYYDSTCLRSKKAYPTLLAQMLGGSVESAACSGANTGAVAAQAMNLGEHGILGEDTQLVTISAGVNDLPWLDAVGACSNLGSLPACSFVLSNVGSAGVGVGQGIVSAIMAVRTYAPTATIRVTGYPKLFGNFSGTCSVGAVAAGTPMKFSQPQGGMLNIAVDGLHVPGLEEVAGLNDAVEGGVAAYKAGFLAMYGWEDSVEYVDVVDAFAGHGLCDSGERWISGLVSGKPADRGFHPNAAGHVAYAHTIAGTLVAP